MVLSLIYIPLSLSYALSDGNTCIYIFSAPSYSSIRIYMTNDCFQTQEGALLELCTLSLYQTSYNGNHQSPAVHAAPQLHAK